MRKFKRKIFVAKLLDLHRFLKCWNFFYSIKSAATRWIVLIENCSLSEVRSLFAHLQKTHASLTDLRFVYSSSIFLKILNSTYFLRLMYGNAAFIVSSQLYLESIATTQKEASYLVLASSVSNQLSFETDLKSGIFNNFFFELFIYLNSKIE